ncbi:MAG: 7-carboxy-7-deazaguanine synthase QueE [Verrucomicrobiota bacterium]
MKLARLGDGPEIFHTIQGEGVSVGMPAVFVRASLCNLHCVWCDTDHTWNFVGTPWKHEKDTIPGYAKHRKKDVIIECEPAEIAERVLAFPCQRVVITGGEPLLQEADFLKMISAIREQQPAYQFEVETNGTRLPSPAFHNAVDQFNVSPKLSNAAIDAKLRLNQEALAFFASSPKAWFKFVVAEPDDLIEIRNLCDAHGIPLSRILLMPEGRTAKELDHSAHWLADICRDGGFRFCDRLHIRLWGDKRGV